MVMSILPIALGVLAVLSVGLVLWQVVAAARFPLHQRTPPTQSHPGVTLLKPLKGSDTETLSCLQSWLEQEYTGPVQALFGVASMDDPVVPIVQKLIEKHPTRNARLVHCPERLGANAKVSQLVQLERFIEHDFVCVSDADVFVPPDFLANAVVPLCDSKVGLVNGFYEFVKPVGLGMRWEAFAVNADFWSQVLQSRTLKPIDFALGAAMVLPRERLQQIGGFASLVDWLADDYQLGHRIARNGASIELCPVVVECRSAPSSFGEVWAHQLRWARTIRACQPAPFFFSILSNATLWPLLWLATSPLPQTLIAVAACVVARSLGGAYLDWRMTRQWNFHALCMAWIKDLLHGLIWLNAFTGSKVVWRGERYQVTHGGRLVKVDL